jgi:hypothetical protein
VPEEAVRIGSCDGGKTQDLGHHEEHDEAAVGIDGYIAWRLVSLLLDLGTACSVWNSLIYG